MKSQGAAAGVDMANYFQRGENKDRRVKLSFVYGMSGACFFPGRGMLVIGKKIGWAGEAQGEGPYGKAALGLCGLVTWARLLSGVLFDFLLDDNVSFGAGRSEGQSKPAVLLLQGTSTDHLPDIFRPSRYEWGSAPILGGKKETDLSDVAAAPTFAYSVQKCFLQAAKFLTFVPPLWRRVWLGA